MCNKNTYNMYAKCNSFRQYQLITLISASGANANHDANGNLTFIRNNT